MKPELLYISPVIPGVTGNGLAMRAGMALEALAERYSVSLLVVQLYRGQDHRVPEGLRRLCRRTAILRPSDPRRPALSFLSRLVSSCFGSLAVYQRLPFDVVHVMRLAALPFARRFFEDRAVRPRVQLDLDDIESATHRRLAALCRSNGDQAKALFEDSEARRCEVAEGAAFRTVDRIYVCSEEDRTELARRASMEICVFPNAVRVPALAQQENTDDTFRFLFIGTLGYYPNEDAALYLCREIVPRLRQSSHGAWGVDIVGGGASERLRRAASDAGVALRGPVGEVETWYHAAGAVVAPLRAGGGTRIKILEAFSYRRPVVSTSIGAEGITARDEQEILIADNPEAFVDACVRLIEDRELRERLTANAFNLVLRSYSAEALQRMVAALGEPGERSGSA